MWKNCRSDDAIEGLVRWDGPESTEGPAAWFFDVRGGPFGIKVFRSDSGLDAPETDTVRASDDECCFMFRPSGAEELPGLAEQFVRGDQLHLSYPQQAGTFGLRLVLRPIRTTESFMVLSVTLSIQTNLLDSHPTIDLVAPAGRRYDVASAEAEYSPAASGDIGTGSCPITFGDQQGGMIALLLGPSDSPFTTDCSSDDEIRLRLFGEFLEKGVIRRARPWIVIGRGKDSLSEADVRGAWVELAESPVPLN